MKINCTFARPRQFGGLDRANHAPDGEECARPVPIRIVAPPEPLTPALSPYEGERETSTQLVGETERVGLSSHHPDLLTRFPSRRHREDRRQTVSGAERIEIPDRRHNRSPLTFGRGEGQGEGSGSQEHGHDRPPNCSRTLRLLAATILVSAALVSARAYSPPPEWDPMLMLNIALDGHNQLSVETTPYIIRLTVAPGAYDSTNKTYDLSCVTFDPAQPYAVLNGTAYSRVLGWYDQGTTGANGDDFYATYAAQLNGNSLWLEKTGGSPEVQTYCVAEDLTGDPGTPYTPIFGTQGSSSKWRWDGRMDHNTYVVALKCLTVTNQLFTATYHLYVGDATGNPVAGYGDTTTTWRWQGPAVAVVPAPSIQKTNGQILVSWTPTLTNLTLLAADAPAAATWLAVTNVPFLLNGKCAVLLEPAGDCKYFRLQLNP
jgi:hypothetical protein